MLKKEIIIAVLIIVSINSIYSQTKQILDAKILEKKVSLSVDSIALDKVFENLSEQAGCYFTYNSEIIDANHPITLHIAEAALHSVLDTILQNPDFSYRLVNNQVIIHLFEINTDKIQNDSVTYKKIEGIVADSETGKALPFASFVIKNSCFGGITNRQGTFTIKIPKPFLNDTLVFSFIGYYNKVLPINKATGKLNVKLEQGIVSLQEVVIRSAEPTKLLEKARSRFRENYNTKPCNFEAFYREAIKRNNRYMIYSEALINGYKPSFLLKYKKNKIQIEKSRKFVDIQSTDTFLVKLSGGIEACFQLDLIHQTPDFLSEKGQEYYNYTINDIIVWQDELVYEISFKQKEYVVADVLFEGKIYISVNNYAIIGADFSFSKQKLQNTNSQFVVKKSRQVRVRPVSTNYNIRYTNFNGRYYINYIRGELSILVKKRKHLFSDKFTIFMEMAYTNVDTVNVKMPNRKDLFQTQTIFSDSECIYSNDFWENRNTIQPEENIMDALKKSGFKMVEQE